MENNKGATLVGCTIQWPVKNSVELKVEQGKNREGADDDVISLTEETEKRELKGAWDVQLEKKGREVNQEVVSTGKEMKATCCWEFKT
jgi:hypothetical protein